MAPPPVVTRAKCDRLVTLGKGRQAACRIYASWLVGIRARAHRDGPTVDYFFEQMKVCNRCRINLVLEDVQTDRSFVYLSKRLVSMGHEPPKRKLSRLIYRHLRLGFTSGG